MRILCLFQRCCTNHRIYRGFRLQRFAKGEHWECAERRLGAAGGYGEFFRRPFGSAGDLCQPLPQLDHLCLVCFPLRQGFRAQLRTDSLAAGRISRKRPTALAARSAWTADLGGVGQLSIFCIGLRPSMGRQGERPGSAKLCMSMDDGHEARYGKADHGGRAALSLRRDADRRWLRIAMCSGVRDSAMPSRRHGSSNVLFSIISFMRTAPREWRRPDPRQAITAACGGRG